MASDGQCARYFGDAADIRNISPREELALSASKIQRDAEGAYFVDRSGAEPKQSQQGNVPKWCTLEKLQEVECFHGE